MRARDVLAVAAVSAIAATSAWAQGRPPSGPEERAYYDCAVDERIEPQTRVNNCSTAIAAGGIKGERRGDLFLARAAAHQELDDLDAALSDANDAIKLLLNKADAYYLRATIYEDEDDADNALQDLNAAIKLDPNHASAYADRGYIYLDRKAPDSALADFNSAIMADSKYPAGHIGRGAIYLTRNQNELAKADFEAVLATDNMDPQAMYGRGVAERRLGDKARGDEDIRAAERVWDQAGDLFRLLDVAQ